MMPCSARYLVTMAAGMPESAKVAVHVQARRDHGGLDRVQHVEAGRQIAEAMPAFARAQHPVVPIADALVGQIVGAPHLEPPVGPKLVVHLAHGAAKIQRLHDRLLHQRRSARRLHHCRRHVAGRDDRVLRAGGTVHQVGFVEDVAIQRTRRRLLHQDLGCLGQAGQQLVGRLRGEHHRFLATGPILADGVHAHVKIVERRVGQPSLVEQQGIDLAVQQALDGVHVVEHAVVGALGDGQDAGLGLDALGERIGLDLALDGLGLELFQRDRPDDSVVVARRHQKHRNRAGHDDRVKDGFVAVAVHHHDVVRRHRRMPDDLVGSRRAVGDEEQVVAVEDAGRVAFRCRDRAGMVEQLARVRPPSCRRPPAACSRRRTGGTSGQRGS